MADKLRVHTLANELGVPSKTIVEKCVAEGIDTVKNHMSTLSAGLHATIREWFSESGSGTALETAERVDLTKARKKVRRRTKATTPKTQVETEQEPAAPVSAQVVAEAPALADATPEPATALVEEAPSESRDPVVETPDALTVAASDVLVEAAPPSVEPPETPDTESKEPSQTPSTESAQETLPAKVAAVETETKPPARPIGPAGPQNVPAAAKLQGPRVVRYEAPDYDIRPIRRRPPPTSQSTVPTAPAKPAVGPVALKKPDAEPARNRGWVGPRRSMGRVVEAGEKIAEWRDRDLEERRERLAGATGRRIHRRRAAQEAGTTAPRMIQGPKTNVTLHEPIRVKEFCAETGLNFMQLFKILKDEHELVANVNMTLPTETAHLLAMHFGLELEVIPARTLLVELEEEIAQRQRENLQPRPTIVTMLGHVDHGKTSLLDAIRATRVVAGEDGGITQHIRSYHLETSHGPVTFVDTPGHEAFSAMRARGAQVTDVVVLVVAADDGLMPQTIEAIRHAQAAEVPIVVALNKIDLGDQNKIKIFGQLAEHGLTPSGDWGGEVDVIETSATQGTGVEDLISHLADLSSVLELQSDPTVPATGTVLDAEMKTGVGAVARILVQDGTLHVGDFIVCGNAFGTVRALLDDRDRRINEAGPSMPVEVWGLDDVAGAGDKLYVVSTLQRAKEIATETKRTRIENARVRSRKSKTLEDMVKRRGSEEVPELNLILKGDVDGSVAALRQALLAIPSDEVRLTIRHAAVGPVNDSDVLLAATCGGMIAAFRVDAAARPRRLAEQHGVDLRSYRVIYDVCDDIRKALSGLLAPERRVEARAIAEVRELFRVSKVGLVAGCYVVQGTVERNHLLKIVRDGVVLREECKIASLRRVKDDVKEVRTNMECGIRVEGFDDIHVGDQIQTYEIVEIARSL
ncbi:MAG: translation initiation factor IF-2 [Planctomycetes bacterium]|nr:translation initiation factor IF-2 [Planctomycetota bacterium]